MATIAQLRQLFPNARSDEDAISLAAKDFGLDPSQVANDVGYNPGRGSLMNERLSSSKDSYDANMYGLGEAISGKMGLTGVQNWMKSGRQDNEFQAQVANSRARALGGIDSYKDVHGFGDTANFIGGVAATAFPYLLENVAWAVGDVITGGALTPAHATRLAAMAPRWLGGEALRAGASVAEHEAAMQAAKGTARGVIGATVPSYASAVGDILGNQRDQLRANGLDDSKTDLLSAAVGGVGYAGAQAFSPLNRMAAGNLPRRAVGALDDMTGFAGGAARLGLNTAITAWKEGAEETFQEFMNQRFGRMVVDPNEEFLSDGAVDRYKESFIGGAALGGVIGGAAGGWRRSGQYKAPEVENGQTTDMLSMEDVGAHSQMLGIMASGANSPAAVGQVGSQWRRMAPEPVGPYSDAALGAVGAQWQSMAPEATGESSPAIIGQVGVSNNTVGMGSLQAQQDQEGAQRAAARDSRITDVGRMAQGLVLDNPEAMVPERLRTLSSPVGARPMHPAVQDAVQQQQAQSAQASQAKAAEDAQQAALRHTLALYGEPETTQIGEGQKMHRWLGAPHYTPESVRSAIAKQAQADAKRAAELKAAPGLAEKAEQAYAGAFKVKETQRAANITSKESEKDYAQSVTPTVLKNREFTKLVDGAQTVEQIAARVRMELMSEQAKAEKADVNKLTLLQEFHKLLTGQEFAGIVDENRQAPTASPVTGQRAEAQLAKNAETNNTATASTQSAPPAVTSAPTAPRVHRASAPAPAKGVLSPQAQKVKDKADFAALRAKETALRAERKTLAPVRDSNDPDAELEVGDYGDVDPASAAGSRIKAIDMELRALVPPTYKLRDRVTELLSAPAPKAPAAAKTDADFKRRLRLATGMEVTEDGVLIQPSNPMTLAEVARREKTSRNNVSKQLLLRGLSQIHLDALVANPMPTDNSESDFHDQGAGAFVINNAAEQEAGVATGQDFMGLDGDSRYSMSDSTTDFDNTDETIGDTTFASGFRKEDSASKAMGEALMSDRDFTPTESAAIGDAVKRIKRAKFSEKSLAQELVAYQRVIDNPDSKAADVDRAADVKSEILNQVAKEGFQADTRSKVDAPPTESDLAFEAKRKQAANGAFMKALAQWAATSRGQDAASDWNDYKSENIGDFDSLPDGAKLDWLKAVYQLDEDDKNDHNTVRKLQREHERNLDPTVQTLPPGAPTAAQNNSAGAQDAEAPAGDSRGDRVRQEPTGGRAEVQTSAVAKPDVQRTQAQGTGVQGRQAAAEISPEVQAKINGLQDTKRMLEGLMRCLRGG